MSVTPTVGRPPRLVLRFALYAALALVLAGAGLVWFVKREAHERAERAADERATFVATTLAHHLKRSDFARLVRGERRVQLDELFTSELGGGFVRVVLRSPTGEATYSLSSAGERRAKVVDASVPVRLEGSRRAVGVLEFHGDYASVASAIESIVTPIALALAVTLLLLYAALFPILRQATSALEHRNRRLTEQAAELERSLEERRRAIASMHEAETRYQALVEQVPLVIYVDALDEHSSAVYMSPQVEPLLGYSTEEWLRDPELFTKLLHPDDHDRVMAEIARAHETNEPFSSEYRLIARDGHVVWFRDEATHVPGHDGAAYAQGFMLDITERKTAEQAVQERAERFRTLVSNIPGVVFRCEIDAEWTMQFLSDEIEELSGYPASDFIGNAVRSFTSIIHPDDVEPLAAEVEEAAAARRPYTTEYRIVPRDGEVRWVLERGQAVDSVDGHVWLDGAMFDITETRSAEDKLKDAEHRYRTLVEQLPLAIYTRPLDMREANLYVSAQVEQILGYPREEWQNDPDILRNVVHPDDLDMVVAEGERVRETGEPFRGEYRCIAKDGRTVWILDETRLVRDADGRPAYVQGFLLDVSARRAAEEARADLAAIVESSDDAIIGSDLEGKITTWNDGAEKTFGWSADEVVGKPITMLAPPGRADEPFTFLKAVTQNQDVAHHEVVRMRKDGTLVDISLTLSPVRDPAGKIVGASAISRDITDRKRAERELERLLVLEREQNERLRELDRLKDEFIALVSHELRTPLTSIRGYLELLLEGEAGDLTDEQRRFLGVVERNAHRLLHLVGDLLFLAQLEAGKVALEVGAVDLAAIASESVEAARPLADERGITLTLATGPAPLLAGDQSRIAQLLDNLVSNALKFTREGGRVDVRVRAVSGNAVLEVRDSGVGIPVDEQEHVFERFFRSSLATERAIPGTGLGLAISKAIVEAHGGRIVCASEESVGTTFTVSLPLREAARGLDKPAPVAVEG